MTPTCPPEHHKIIKTRGAGNSALGHDDTMTANDDVVGDLDKIVDLGSFADHRVAACSPVDGSVATDLDIVLDDHPTDLGDLAVTVGPHGETEAVLPDPNTRVDDHAIADQGMQYTRSRPYAAAPTNAHMRTDHRIGRDDTAFADLGARPYHGAGVDRDAGLQTGARVNHASGTDFRQRRKRTPENLLPDRGVR